MNDPNSRRRFRMQERLRSKADIARVFAVKCSASDSLMTLFLAKNGLAWSRLAVSISRKHIAGAVQRNKVRRRIRENYRQMKDNLSVGVDVVCLVRGPAVSAGYADLGKSLETLIIKGLAKTRRSEAGSKPQSAQHKEPK